MMLMEMEMERVTTTILYNYDSVLAVILWFRSQLGQRRKISAHTYETRCVLAQ